MVLIADTLEHFYSSYFEGLAEEYCGHAIGTAKPHFYVNNFIESISEVNEAVRSKLSAEGVSMVLDMFDDELEMGDGLTLIVSGAFSVIKKYDTRNPESLRAVRKDCRAKARQILMRMKRDSYFSIDPEAALAKHAIEVVGTTQGVRLGVVGDTFSGWAYTFSWRLPEHLFFGT